MGKVGTMMGSLRAVGDCRGGLTAWLRAAAAALVAMSAASCLELETKVHLNEDGSATITERLTLSERLLDLGEAGGPVAGVARLLTREAALERMKEMGPAVSLVSHEVREAPRAAREAAAVYHIPDFRQFRYVSPYLAALNYPKHHVVACDLFPVYESTWYGRRASEMGVTFKMLTRERSEDERREPPPAPAPRDLQVLRDLSPLFQDFMHDFRLRLTFESYAPLRFRQYYRYRGRRARTLTYDLIDFSGENLDNYGQQFLGNEEVMLELLRLQLGGPNVVQHVADHGDNLTVPVFHPRGTPEIYFRPSRPFFDAHFAGKTLKFDRREGGERPAKWEEIGSRPAGQEASD